MEHSQGHQWQRERDAQQAVARVLLLPQGEHLRLRRPVRGQGLQSSGHAFYVLNVNEY